VTTNVGNDTFIVDGVTAKLRAIGAMFDSGKVSRHHTVFDHIGWQDIGIGQDPFWTLGCLVDNQADIIWPWVRSTEAN